MNERGLTPPGKKAGTNRRRDDRTVGVDEELGRKEV